MIKDWIMLYYHLIYILFIQTMQKASLFVYESHKNIKVMGSTAVKGKMLLMSIEGTLFKKG